MISPKMDAKDKRKPISPNEKSFSDDLWLSVCNLHLKMKKNNFSRHYFITGVKKKKKQLHLSAKA